MQRFSWIFDGMWCYFFCKHSLKLESFPEIVKQLEDLRYLAFKSDHIGITFEHFIIKFGYGHFIIKFEDNKGLRCKQCQCQTVFWFKVYSIALHHDYNEILHASNYYLQAIRKFMNKTYVKIWSQNN